MYRFLTAVTLLSVPAGVAAQEFQTLGYGRLFTNDFFADGHDRWRTGSYQWSMVRGKRWDGVRPSKPGEIVEYRLRVEIIAPSQLQTYDPNDRQSAGIVSFGVHTHWNVSNYDLSFGAGFEAVGPQTKVLQFQDDAHKFLGAQDVETAKYQIGDAIYGKAVAEIARPIVTPGKTIVRPFAELIAGPETMARIGVDVLIGGLWDRDLLMRDAVTGHIIPGIEDAKEGLGFVIGADISHVAHSEWLNNGNITTKQTRARARAGVNWQIDKDTSLFYGVTWLSEEFEEQSQGQFVGSIKVNFKF